jgi:hypothetical protein
MYWDGQMTHNPTIHKSGDKYLLFYIGATYDGLHPKAEDLAAGTVPWPKNSYSTIRIGLAVSNSVFGPWIRRDAPILVPRPKKWDSEIVTNPAACVHEDGSILLIYRSNTPNGLRLGIAKAAHHEDKFERLCDEPILIFEKGFVEDPYLWRNRDHYELIAKDMTGDLCGEMHAGIHATSRDAINWRLSDPPKAYSRHVLWNDGTITVQGCLERPQLLIENGRPTHLFAATGDGPGGFEKVTRTWNMVIPLKLDD